jgi:adenylate cyclase
MKKYTKFLLSPWLALITVMLLLAVKLSNPFLVDALRLKYYDYLMLGKAEQSDQIVVANIGEKAIEKYGQWPFPRDIHAKILEELYSNGAGLVASTVMFPEKDRFNKDSVFAESMKKNPVVLSQTLTDKCSRNNSQTRRTGVAVIGDGKPTEFLPNYPCVLDNIPELQSNALGVGIASSLPESDGVVRRVPLIGVSNGEYYPAFALEVLRVVSGDPSYQAKINQTGVEALRVPQFGKINTDEYGRVFINPNYVFDSVEIGDKLPELKNKIVILGVSANGVANPVATPSGPQYPHSLQASLLQTLINGDSLSIPNYVAVVDLAAFVVLSILIIILSRIRFGLYCIVILLGAYIYAPTYFFTEYKILFDISFNVLAMLLVYMHIYTVKFISELLQKQQIKKQFGTYLSPDLVAQLQRQPELLQLGGTEQELSIMFTDVRGFTTISEHYGKDVQGLTKIMNRYMTAMTKAILENKGTLDKYIGDAQMAFWNAPLDNPKHAKDAVSTAFQMLKSLEEFNAIITEEGVPAFGMGLGINTDTVVVGNMGSDQRFDYTCLGDGVNLASRLEGQSKPYGVKIVLGPKTAEYVKDEYFTLELDCIAVKGKTQGVTIYTVLGSIANLKAECFLARGIHDMMLQAYRDQKWDQALSFIDQIYEEFDGELHKYYDMMKERVEELRGAKLSTDWDGVYRATSK